MAKFLDTAGLTYLWSKIKTALSGKVDKVNGKGLSTNDYTTAEKNKLAGIEAGANKYTHPSYTAKTNGLYKMTVDANGHVSAANPVTKKISLTWVSQEVIQPIPISKEQPQMQRVHTDWYQHQRKVTPVKSLVARERGKL